MDGVGRNLFKLRLRKTILKSNGKSADPQSVDRFTNNAIFSTLEAKLMKDSKKHPAKIEEEHPLNFFEDDNVPAIQETLVKISGAVVHLLDLEGSVSLARGDLSIVRIVQGSTGLTVFAKVGNDLSWPITKDGPIIKLNTMTYLFFVLVPSAVEGNESPQSQFKILNYGVTFTEKNGREEELPLLQKWLGKHGCLSKPKYGEYGFKCLCLKPNFRDDIDVYWTRLAPCVKRYSFILGSAIAAGSGKIIQGMFFCNHLYLFRVQKAGKVIRKRANGKGKHLAVGRKEKAGLSASPRENIKRALELSRMVERMRENVLNGMLIARAVVNGYVLGAEASNMLYSLLPAGEVLIASFHTMSSAFLAIDIILEAATVASGRVYAMAITGRASESIWNMAIVRIRRNDAELSSNGESEQARLSVVIYDSKACVWRRGCERTCVLSTGV